MPSPAAFRKALGLEVGEEFAGYQLATSKVGHLVVTPSKKYRFPIKLLFQPTKQSSNPNKLVAALKKHVSTSRTVYSIYGSPYACKCGELKLKSKASKDTVEIVTEGVATRDKSLPTLKEEYEHHHATDTEEQEEIEPILKQHGLRVITSRFSTSKCAICDQLLEPGAKIAKRASSSSRGGWSHLLCAYNPLDQKSSIKTSKKHPRDSTGELQRSIKKERIEDMK